MWKKDRERMEAMEVKLKAVQAEALRDQQLADMRLKQAANEKDALWKELEWLRQTVREAQKELDGQREKNARLQELLEKLGGLGRMIREDVEQERKRRQEHDKQWSNMMAWQPEAGWGVGDER